MLNKIKAMTVAVLLVMVSSVAAESPKKLAAGWRHSVAVDEKGQVWSWGENRCGQLGNGSFTASHLPTPVKGANGNGRLEEVVAISAGTHHTLAILRDGTIRAWGNNAFGQLGNGRWGLEQHSTVPVPVLGSKGEDLLRGVVAVAAGWDHSVAVLDDGTVWAWGSSCQGQLGDGVCDSNRWSAHPVQVLGLEGKGRLERVRAVACGIHHTIALGDDGTVWAWGGNWEGQLGIAPNQSSAPPEANCRRFPVRVRGIGGEGYFGHVKAIAAGVFHNVAALEDGRAVAWGYNGGGQLGEGTRGSFWEGNTKVRHLPAPVPVVDVDGQNVLEGVVAVGAGYEVSWALIEDGTMRSWGWNVFGELGGGLPLGGNRARPQTIRLGQNDDDPPLGRIVEFAGGVRHGLARDAEGRIWAWGHNGFGQLAATDLMDRTFPIEVPEFSEASVEQRDSQAAAKTQPRALHYQLPNDARRFNVRDHGAAGDGVHLDMAAIQAAVDAAHAAGGGIVLAPPGVYRTGTVQLKSGVHLHVEEGATILGSTNRTHYPQQGLIYADGARDIAITGSGVIDGQGQAFASRGWRVQIFYLDNCDGVNVCDITTRNSGSWTQHYIRCRNLSVRGSTVNSPRPGRNNDGIDLSGCEDVLIEDCTVISDDDAIVIKSQSSDRVNRNYRVLNNRVFTYRGAFKLGTETRAPYSNLVVRNLEGWGPKALELYSVDGTQMENIDIEGVRAHDAQAAILIRLGARLRPHYFGAGEEVVPGYLRGVRIKNVEVELSDKSYREILLEHGIENAGAADCCRYRPRESFISGLPGHRIEDVRIEDVSIRYPGGGAETDVFRTVPERPEAYPAAGMFGPLPAYGLYCRHADVIQLRNVTIRCESPDPRPLLVCDDVKNLLVDRIEATSASTRFPVIWLSDVHDAEVQNCTAPPGTDVFVAATGTGPALDGIRLTANDTRQAATPLRRLAPGELVASGLPKFAETSPGLVAVEAEAMWLVEPMSVEGDADRPSDRYIIVPAPGNRDRGDAYGRFDVSTPGEYVVWARAFGDSGESDSFYASIDRAPSSLTDLKKLGAWHWTVVRDRIAGEPAKQATVFQLQAGEHTLQIRNRESGTKIDKVVIVRKDLPFEPQRDLPSR